MLLRLRHLAFLTSGLHRMPPVFSSCFRPPPPRLQRGLSSLSGGPSEPAGDLHFRQPPAIRLELPLQPKKEQLGPYLVACSTEKIPDLLLDSLPADQTETANFVTKAAGLNSILSATTPVHLLGRMASGKSRTLAEVSCLRFAVYVHPKHRDFRDLFASWLKQPTTIPSGLDSLIFHRLAGLEALLRGNQGAMIPRDWYLFQQDQGAKARELMRASSDYWQAQSASPEEKLQMVLKNLEQLGIQQPVPVLVDDGDMFWYLSQDILPNLFRLTSSNSLPLCVASETKDLQILGSAGDRVFSDFPHYLTAQQAWGGYASRYIPEQHFAEFEKVAYPWLKGPAGFISEFCQEYLTRGLFEHATYMLKGCRSWSPMEVETLLEAVEKHGLKWVHIRDYYMPNRTWGAVRAKYLEVQKRGIRELRSPFYFKDLLLKSRHEEMIKNLQARSQDLYKDEEEQRKQ